MKVELEVKDKTKRTEGLKIAPFKQHTRKTSAHKHNNYFEIIYLTKGRGIHTIDTKEYEIRTPIIFTIRKEQVHFWDFKTEPEGFVLIIKKSYIKNCLDKDIKRLILDLSAQTCLFPKNNDVINFFNLLLAEQREKKKPNQLIIDGLLKAILAKLLESVIPHISKSSNSTIFEKYIDLLSEENKLTNKVNHYAKLLNTAPQNLNAICRKETGQSSAEILSEYITNEAKRLLLYTDLRVSEIAHRLDFNDNSYFTKYFKRHVQQTPVSYRSNNN